MKTANSIQIGFVYQMTDEQVRTANQLGTVKKVWMVDGNIPAISITSKNEPTHWWQQGKWERVTFLSLTEVKQ